MKKLLLFIGFGILPYFFFAFSQTQQLNPNTQLRWSQPVVSQTAFQHQKGFDCSGFPTTVYGLPIGSVATGITAPTVAANHYNGDACLLAAEAWYVVSGGPSPAYASINLELGDGTYYFCNQDASGRGQGLMPPWSGSSAATPSTWEEPRVTITGSGGGIYTKTRSQIQIVCQITEPAPGTGSTWSYYTTSYITAPTGCHNGAANQIVCPGDGSSFLNAAVTFPWLKSDDSVNFPNSNWEAPLLRGISIDANGLADACLENFSVRYGDAYDVSCTNATGPKAWIFAGGTASKYVLGFAPCTTSGCTAYGTPGLSSFNINGSDFDYYHINIETLLYNENTVFTATATPAAGVIGPAQITITNPGVIGLPSCYNSPCAAPTALPLYLQPGGGNPGSNVCTTMPTSTLPGGGTFTGMLANLSPISGNAGHYQVTSISDTTPGSGCSGTIYAKVFPIPAAAWGFYAAETDSRFYHLDESGVGWQYSHVADGGEQYYYGLHPVNVPIGIADFGQATFVGTELDTIFNYNVEVKYTTNGAGSKWFSPSNIWLQDTGNYLLAGSSGWLFDSGTQNTSISSYSCGVNNQDEGGWVQYTRAGNGSSYGPMTPIQAQLLGYVSPMGSNDSDVCITPQTGITGATTSGSTTMTTTWPHTWVGSLPITGPGIPGLDTATSTVAGTITLATAATATHPSSTYVVGIPNNVSIDDVSPGNTGNSIIGTQINGGYTIHWRNANGATNGPILLATLQPYVYGGNYAPSINITFNTGETGNPQATAVYTVYNDPAGCHGQWRSEGDEHTFTTSSGYVMIYNEAAANSRTLGSGACNVALMMGNYGYGGATITNVNSPQALTVPPVFAQYNDTGYQAFDGSGLYLSSAVGNSALTANSGVYTAGTTYYATSSGTGVGNWITVSTTNNSVSSGVGQIVTYAVSNGGEQNAVGDTLTITGAASGTAATLDISSVGFSNPYIETYAGYINGYGASFVNGNAARTVSVGEVDVNRLFTQGSSNFGTGIQSLTVQNPGSGYLTTTCAGGGLQTALVSGQGGNATVGITAVSGAITSVTVCPSFTGVNYISDGSAVVSASYATGANTITATLPVGVTVGTSVIAPCFPNNSTIGSIASNSFTLAGGATTTCTPTPPASGAGIQVYVGPNLPSVILIIGGGVATGGQAIVSTVAGSTLTNLGTGRFGTLTGRAGKQFTLEGQTYQQMCLGSNGNSPWCFDPVYSNFTSNTLALPATITAGNNTLTVASFTITAAAAASQGTQVLTGSFPLGNGNVYTGQPILIVGDSQGANDGTFTISGSTTSTITINNGSGVASSSGSTGTLQSVWQSGQPITGPCIPYLSVVTPLASGSFTISNPENIAPVCSITTNVFVSQTMGILTNHPTDVVAGNVELCTTQAVGSCATAIGTSSGVIPNGTTTSQVANSFYLVQDAATYMVNAVVQCDTSVASATSALSVAYTDASNTVQTNTATATCTTLGTASLAQMQLTIRPKSGTYITYRTVIVNAPVYEGSVSVAQITPN